MIRLFPVGSFPVRTLLTKEIVGRLVSIAGLLMSKMRFNQLGPPPITELDKRLCLSRCALRVLEFPI